MRETEPPPQNKTETKKESFKEMPLSEKERWADGALRDASKLKDDSLEMKELGAESFTEKERLVLSDLKKALKEGKMGDIDAILEKHKINSQEEKRKIFKEFSLLEVAIDAAIEALDRGETKFNSRNGYKNFERYLLPQIANDPDFQNIALVKTKEYMDKNNPLPAYDLMFQFLPEEITKKENFPLQSKQLLIRILNDEPFLINNFKTTLFGFGKFITEEALLESDMQQAAKQTITKLSKRVQQDGSALSDILELKEVFHIN